MITILISKIKLRLLLSMLVALVMISACADEGADSEALTVLATTSIWGDVVEEVVGDAGTVTVLLPVGADAHDYRPSSRDVETIETTDLVIANGLGLEAGLVDVLDAAAADGANIYEVAPDLDPLPQAGEHEHDALDPHVWFDPSRMARAAELIADRLIAIDPTQDWAARAADYADRLEATDADIEALFQQIPEERRKLVTNHESLGYLAARFHFEVIGAVIPGGSTLADPSSAELAALVDEIIEEDVQAIFVETSSSARLAESVAAEVGEDIAVIELFTESLGEPGSGAETLVDMLLTDAGRIVDGLS